MKTYSGYSSRHTVFQIEGAQWVLDGEVIGEYLHVLGLRTFEIARPSLLLFLDRRVIALFYLGMIQVMIDILHTQMPNV